MDLELRDRTALVTGASIGIAATPSDAPSCTGVRTSPYLRTAIARWLLN